MDSIAALGAQYSGELLRQAAALSGPDLITAYELLAPSGRPAIRFLGPAFFTKHRYFAGGGAPEHSCLIRDARVVTALYRHGWTSLPGRSTGWPATTYGRYITLVKRWCNAAARPGRATGRR